MSKPIPSSALPVAYLVLRILIVLNWLYGAGILAILIVSIVNEPWLMAAFKLSPSPEAARIVMGLRIVAVLGLVTIPIYRILLTRLLAIVDTLRVGDPFVGSNALRLHTIGWMLLAINILSIVIGAIGSMVSTEANPVHLDAGFSISGWLAVLLTFVLARVFAEGSRMRDDLEGTV